MPPCNTSPERPGAALLENAAALGQGSGAMSKPVDIYSAAVGSCTGDNRPARNRKLAAAIVSGLVVMLPALPGAENGGAAGSGAPAFPDIQQIKDRGRLIVAQAEEENPPFSMMANEPASGVSEAMQYELPSGQSVVGIDIEMANAIARALGVRLDLRREHPTPRSVIEAVSRGEADLGISNLGVTLDRLQKVLFSAPYARSSLALLIHRNCLPAAGVNPPEISSRHPLLRSLDHPGWRVAVEKQSTSCEVFSVIFPHATPVPYESEAELGRLLLTQSVDAALGGEFGLRLQTQSNPELALYFSLLVISDHEERIAAAINPRMPNLAPIADEVALHHQADSIEQLLAAHASMLASQHGTSSPAQPELSARAGQEPGGSAARGGGFPLQPVGAIGLALIALTATWLRMAKKSAPPSV